MIVSLRDTRRLSFRKSFPDGGLSIGSTKTLSVIESSELLKKGYKTIAYAAGTNGSIQIRNRATVGGNLCNAALSADMAPILFAYDSSVVITDGTRSRLVSLQDLLTDSECTVLKDGKL